ncbi:MULTISPECIES: hypothetical protein [unclassified Saccharopolyspora]|uniref:hypothetical protein n=1 Tax=unclassified Saccharopolyspora TaxID=2646250 RepID=UPI001CD6204D|nr:MULTISPECIES: hypothetical protein [unclassified Saccharopolyspora]MCA1189009.1 hypothetical protein [Saccharopolyspora sp. 6T]MCA1228900.1 hypothetical protein [Saccharopolyspora sp. 6M]MCA1281915.1 hypothetical protein [Saccharopolyspora sp. 7B]
MGAAALLGGALLAGTVGAAAASAAEPGAVQFCAQGDYAAYVDIHSVDLGDGTLSPGMLSTVQEPGQCWESDLGSIGPDAPVDVWGIRADGSTFHVGASTVDPGSGTGLGAQGTAANPSLAQW